MTAKRTQGVCFRLAVSLSLTLLCLARAAGQEDEVARSHNRPVEPYRIIGNVHYQLRREKLSGRRGGVSE